jgi:nicotinamidase/pyrazinamidase
MNGPAPKTLGRFLFWSHLSPRRFWQMTRSQIGRTGVSALGTPDTGTAHLFYGLCAWGGLNFMPHAIALMPSDALLIVDVQKDFLPDGRLPVPGGDQVVPVLNQYIELFLAQSLPVIATRDWHPPQHCSFMAQGGPWPTHCIAESDGARFAESLHLPHHATIISKAMTEDKDAYSGFQDTDLAKKLRSTGVKRVFIGGLATDYCVLNTVLEAVSLSFHVCLLLDAIRAVNIHAGDGQRAIARMLAHGVQAINLADVVTILQPRQHLKTAL